jgi:hypothetical protein
MVQGFVGSFVGKELTPATDDRWREGPGSTLTRAFVL